jgi:hypothetical protein
MEPNINTRLAIGVNKTIHFYKHPVWLFNSKTLTIVDGNNDALTFCQYEKHEFIGLSITELWHGEDLDRILDDIHVSKYEQSFYGQVKHKKKNGEIVKMRLRATRLANSESLWIVHLVDKPGGY